MGTEILKSLNDLNIKSWPEDWDIHFLKTCELYFDNEEDEVNFLVGTIYFQSIVSSNINDPNYDILRNNTKLESIEFRGLFTYKDNLYTALVRKDSDYLIGSIFKNKEITVNINPGDNVIQTNHSFFISKILRILKRKSPFEFAKKLEIIILEDYLDDKDDEDQDDEPIFPIEPSSHINSDTLLTNY